MGRVEERTVSPRSSSDRRQDGEWPEVLTAREVAEFLRLNYLTVLKLTREGQLPALAVGREYRYLRSEIESRMRDAAAGPRPGGDDAAE